MITSLLLSTVIFLMVTVTNSQTFIPGTIGDTGVTLAVLNNTLPMGNFTCGQNRFQTQVGHLFNTTECRNLRDPMDVCCVAHDTCYDSQLTKINCDNSFCECLSTATEKNLCAIDAAGLCAAARLFGQPVYDTAGGLTDVSPVVN